LRITLICKDAATPYSGMLPGLIAGHYRFDEMHIELRPLCHFAGAQFITTRSPVLIWRVGGSVCSPSTSAIDFLSINTGSTPVLNGVPGAREYTLPVKPIGCSCRLEKVIGKVLASPALRWCFAVVGGGAGGVELLLAAPSAPAPASERSGRPTIWNSIWLAIPQWSCRRTIRMFAQICQNTERTRSAASPE
jgi:selenide,water dikinase